jgi:SAM-dependent methyltransferase
MKGSPEQKGNYGNWVSKRLIYLPAVMTVICLGLSLLAPVFLSAAVLFLVLLIYFAFVYYKFSPKGGDVQSRIRELVIERVDWDGEGRAIEIGCGNGALAISMAKKYPGSHVTGIDYWGPHRDYAKELCTKNAEIEGVSDRMSFQKVNAVALPFPDGYFDLAVSNLVFHDVQDAKDKRDVIKEALRVVKKGGKFVFQDLFLEKRIFGKPEDLLNTIKGWGVENVEFIPTSNSDFIPGALRLPFMLGSIGIISGTK